MDNQVVKRDRVKVQQPVQETVDLDAIRSEIRQIDDEKYRLRSEMTRARLDGDKEKLAQIQQKIDDLDRQRIAKGKVLI